MAPITRVSVYIDPHCDRRTNATGTKELPFNDLISAFIAFPPATSDKIFKYFVRDASSSEWVPVIDANLNLAAGCYASDMREMHKIEEEERLRQATLVEARKFELHPDEKLPISVKMKISARELTDI